MKFIDTARIYVKSGDGGNGHISFRREKFVPKGGPDGGNGGRGGNVVFRTNPQISTLLDFRYKRKYEAENGVKGSSSNKTGLDGNDEIIEIPVGTIIRDAETGHELVDLSEPNINHILLHGGRGGKGNAEFATATHQAPRHAQEGRPGEELNIELELKLIADVGIVGFPNVGKSTLISVMSAAKPKIADYPFTTLVPNLGIVKVEEYKSFVIADIPGLIEGASEGKGLGIQFLRHVERTRVLLFLLDALSENQVQDYNILKEELKKYNPEMLDKESLIAISRCDTIDDEKLEELKALTFDGKKPIIISSVSSINIKNLTYMLYDLMKK